MMKVKIVCAITMLVALPAAAETKSRPIRQELVHEYARKQESMALAPSPIIKHGAPGEKDTCVTEWKD
jgi:hypothetical protein